MPESAGQGRRLLWIHQNFVSARQTGISRAVYFLSALANAGWTVDLVCARTGYLDEALDADLSATIVESDRGITLHRLGVPVGLSTMQREDRGKSYFGFNERAIKYVRTNLPQPDLIFCSSPPLTIALPAIELAMQWRLPLLLEIRDLWPAMLTEANLVRNPAVVVIMQWFEAFAVHFADHVIPVAPTFATYYELMGVSPNKLTVNATGGDPIYLHSSAELGQAWRAEHGIPPEQFLVVFTGSMNEISDIALLAASAAQAATVFPEVLWLFAGNGRGRPHVEEAVANHPATIRYIGAVPRDELLGLYCAADVGLIARAPFPLEETVYPGKLFDYMGSALPIITSHLGQPALVVERANCGMVVRQREPAAILAALKAMIAMPTEERRAMGQRGQTWMLESMNSYRMGDALRELVERPWPRRSVIGQGLHWLIAALQATGDTLVGRQRRAARILSGTQRERLIREAFERWCTAHEATTPRPLDFRLPTPTVLSARDS